MQPTPVADSSAVADSLSQFYTSDFTFQWLMFDSNIVYYVAVAIGFFIIFVSYFFGGGKKNKIKIFLSILMGALIGLLTFPLLLKIAGTDQPLVIAFFILIDVIFTATVTCHMYELVVIGTHEGFDQNPMT